MSSRAPNYSITTRSGTRKLQIRYYVPTEFQTAFGKKEVLRSLKTEDMKVAKQLAIEEAAKITAEIMGASAKAVTASTSKLSTLFEPTRQQIDEAARYVYSAQVQSDLDELMDPVATETAQRGTDESARRYRAHASEIRRAAMRGDHAASDPNYWQDLFGFTFQAGSVAESTFRQRISWAVAEAAERWADHDEGNIGQSAKNPVFEGIRIAAADDRDFPSMPTAGEKPSDGGDAVASSGPGLPELWPQYERLTAHTIDPSTMLEKKSKVERFAEYVGQDTPVDTLSKAQARTWRDLLVKTPKSAQQREDLKRLSIEDAVAANERLNLPTLGHEAINKHVRMCSSFFDWLVKNGHVESNIFDGLAVAKPKKFGHQDSSVAPFTVQQLQRLFDAPLFAGCAGDHGIRQLMTPGDVRIRNWRFWVPVLALYTGARQAELVQLEVADIGCKNGIDFIKITSEGVDARKRAKTRTGLRSIPVHSRLIELGFLDLVARQRSAGHHRLFPEPQRDRRGHFTNAQKELMKPIRAMEFGLDPQGRRYVFHSFRHTFIDELRRAYTESDIAPLVGHASSGVTRRYGTSEVFDLPKRSELISHIRYDGLDLSRLMPKLESHS